MKTTKRVKLIREQISPDSVYAITDAIDLLQKLPKLKFNQSIDIAINLGVDAKKSDQVVRGACILPNGTGKTVRVAVFADGENAKAATDAGADVVGMDDLVDTMKGGDLNFDVVIASPETMRVVGKLGTILGPRGLMPNPKVGTVTKDVATAVKNAKSGQVRFRTDKAGIIHTMIGKLDFTNQALVENLNAMIATLNKLKPSVAKGIYIKKISISSTMGPGLVIDKATLEI
ncbi:MAG: 50S ribosomal protein L1 [Gammaproteobacteria bacterium]|nr:MAG: 50S ribosomal protein L1 [Gammaproteobacteria bacterium]